MKTKTSELSGAGLDWAVGVAAGLEMNISYGGHPHLIVDGMARGHFKPSTDWSQGGPLIESAPLDLEWNGVDGKSIWWTARHDDGSGTGEQGPTPLIAACRAIVAANLGDEVELPESLR